MSDTQPTLPLPDPQARWVLSQPDAAPRRRRAWPWLLAGAIVVVLAVAAWLIGEQVARGIVERTIREQIVTHLSLPVDQQIDVDVPGAILPQLIVGSLGEVTVESDDVTLQGITGDVTVTAADVPIRGGADWSSGHATISLDEAQIQQLLSRVDGFPASSVTLDAPDIAFSTELSVLGASVPVGVGLSVATEDGSLLLTPDTLRLAGAEVPAQVLVDQFGALARTVVRDWEVCVAQYLPRALTLTSTTVESDAVVAVFDIDSAVLTDPAARETGTCA
ncbi:DUF2993 domain-containing protein [Microbacterium telephonicum]|uniref:DUF2993 family protein n=1 Tax=Microbacterium telephonicum TaxID=1714841 RepID=A0A498BUQ8_9MICO|nr:DUF2993 domain-containing protein [Microbacterium telephonicum]RLK47594.1 hypothetical protein C7474_2185 [Microbacterium telephonicum]